MGDDALLRGLIVLAGRRTPARLHTWARVHYVGERSVVFRSLLGGRRISLVSIVEADRRANFIYLGATPLALWKGPRISSRNNLSCSVGWGMSHNVCPLRSRHQCLHTSTKLRSEPFDNIEVLSWLLFNDLSQTRSLWMQPERQCHTKQFLTLNRMQISLVMSAPTSEGVWGMGIQDRGRALWERTDPDFIRVATSRV